MKNKLKLSRYSLGCVLDASSDSATDLNLETIALARRYGAKLGRLPSVKREDYDQIVSEMADSAVNHLNDLESLPPYCSFYFEDNCLFLMPSLESAEESVGFKSRKERDETTSADDAAYPCDSFRGEWLHASDHGNATLYVREDAPSNAGGFADREIWSLV